MTTILDRRTSPSRGELRELSREATIATALALAAAVILTWPLLRELGHTAHDPFDPRFQAWTIDWVQHALRKPFDLFDANIFAPEQRTLAYSDSLIGVAIPLLPFRWIGVSPIGQVNIALLLGTAMSAGSAYLFGRVVSRSRMTGAFAAVAFAFGPFGTLSNGALHTTVKAGIPLAALGAWWLAERAEARGPMAWPAVLLIAAASWQLSVSFYPGAYAVAAAATVLLVRARSLGRRGAKVAVGALLAIAGVAIVLAIPYFRVRGEFPSFERSLDTLGPLGADFFATDNRLSIWGDLLGKGSGWPVFGVPTFPGLVLCVLAPVGLIGGWRRGPRARRVVITAGALVGVGVVLGLGTASTGWRAWSPYRLLYEFVPGFNALRATGRGWAVGVLGLGVLAGLGASVIVDAFAKRRAAHRRGIGLTLACVAVLGVLVEGFAPWKDLPTVEIPAVDRALADLPASGGVLYLPALEPSGAARALSGFRQAENTYATTAHWRRTPNGYSGFSPPSWPKLSRVVERLPDTRAIERLRSIDVRFVVVRSWAAGGTWGPLLDAAQARPLRLIGRYDGDVLYEVPERG